MEQIVEMEEMNQLEEMPIYVCAYCGKEVPDGVDHPNLFSCCGEVGHVEEQ